MRRLIGFVGRFALAYSLGVLLWMAALERPYNEYLAWASTHLLAALEQPRLTTGVRCEAKHLVAEHAAYFTDIPPDQIITRRVYGNTLLFAALTLATPGVTWAARGAWLLIGGAVLSTTHVAHVLTFIHWRYALHNAGPYASSVALEEVENRAWGELWNNPPALRRRLVLEAATVFNIVLQRLLPCVLWLPLFLHGLRGRGAVVASATAAAGPVWRPSRRGVAVVASGVALILISALALARASRLAPPASVEGVQLGMGVEAAQHVLKAEGYVWTTSPRPKVQEDSTLVSTFADVWPPRLLAQRGRARYNWIGLRITRPMGESAMLGCVTEIETAPSETRPESQYVEAHDPTSACREHWHSIGRWP